MPHQPQPGRTMPLLRFPIRLRGEPDLSNLSTRALSFKIRKLFARFAALVRDAVPANADLGLGLFLLFTWQVTSIAVKPKHLALATLLTLLLLVYGHCAFGKTIWLRRVGWVSPRQGFWLYSFVAGVAAAVGVWSIARMFHQSLDAVPPPYKVLLATSSGAMLEELLFRGLFFWLLFQILSRVGAFQRYACAATVLVLAFAFALSHVGRTGLSLFTTVLTGAAFGWMRARSESAAAAALMHGVYNFVLSWIATL